MSVKDKPNPGSKEALDMGCTCPVLDNGHGNPELGRIRGFVYNLDCPVHGAIPALERLKEACENETCNE